MTREEALRRVKGYLTDYIPADNYEEVEEIVEELEQDPCEYEELDFVQPHKKIPVTLVLSENTISREAVEDIVMYYDGQGEVFNEIHKLPSIYPKPKTGCWISTLEQDDAGPFILWKCSECHTLQRLKTKFCPNCGAKMTESEENV